MKTIDTEYGPWETCQVNEEEIRRFANQVSQEYLTTDQVAEVLPNTTAKNVRQWCKNGHVAGAFRLPSGRWQVPWSAVVDILGFDPRREVSPPAAEQGQ